MKSENRALKDRMHQLAEPSTSPDGTEKRLLSISAIRAIADEFEISVSQMEILALSERIVPARYERSQGTVGWDGQIRLLESTVAIVGYSRRTTSTGSCYAPREPWAGPRWKWPISG